jgi:membrane protease YdiL (CAAX protease family)
MTALTTPSSRPIGAPAGEWREAALVTAGLAAVTAARWGATRAGLDALAVGAAFGLALLLLVAAGDGVSALTRRATKGDARELARTVLIGALAGLVLAGIAVIGPALGGSMRIPGLARPDGAFLPWALVTVLVASTEEALLRGVLFDRLTRTGGIPLAIGVTTLAFALLHVPLYGWHVLPLDLAVGLGLGGLRVATRTIAAPAAAHAVADLVTWWL